MSKIVRHCRSRRLWLIIITYRKTIDKLLLRDMPKLNYQIAYLSAPKAKYNMWLHVVENCKTGWYNNAGTVAPATRGHCQFGAKVSPRGRWFLVAGIDILTQISTGIRLVHISCTHCYCINKTGLGVMKIGRYLSHDDHHVHCME